MRLSLHTDAQTFLAAAGPMLYTRETVNNLILGVSERLARAPHAYENPFFATVNSDDGEICLAAVMTPPHNLILAGEPGAETGFATLIDLLKGYLIPTPGVVAAAELAEQFAADWTQLTGEVGEVSMRMRVYELRQVSLSTFPHGTFQQACPADIPTIARWMQAFEHEALGKTHDLDIPRAEQLVTAGNAFTWMLGDQPVSMAMKSRPIAHSITVGGVYTPPEQRCHGYASAVVANLSQHLLDEGYQFVNLFTDLDNPTSNQVYQDVGYHPVHDFLAYRFTKAA
jgi:hypothetical protein